MCARRQNSPVNTKTIGIRCVACQEFAREEQDR